MKLLNVLLGGLLAFGFFLAVIILPLWLEVYHFQDCRRVGHTKLYCILDIVR